ncbi:MAG: nucleotidyltransferase family protein [Woeseiaceae bacterium]
MAEKRIFAVILAAGVSSRFGSPKQLEKYDGAPLVTRAVRLAESVCGSRTMLVAGHQWLAVVHACRPLRGYFTNNARYRSGMAASIACGVRSVAAAADAVLLLLADQPLVTRAHLDALIAAFRASPGNITATGFAETAGPPVIFPRRYFAELCDLQGDAGARSILAHAADRVRTVTFENASVDVDRPEDLGRLP